MRDPISLIAQGSWRAASKADSHADVTRGEPKPLVETLRIRSRLMRQQFDQIAAARFRFRHRPLHQLLADAAAAAIGSNADVFEQTPPAALRAETRQDRELQAADHRALALGNHELDILIALDPRECLVIGRRQRVFYALACAPEMIVGEHRHDRSNVLAARGTNGDGFGVHEVTPASARLTRLGKPEKGLGFADPAADGGITTDIEAAFMRDARIGKQRDVGKRNRITGEETAAGEMLLHAIERRIAALDL